MEVPTEGCAGKEFMDNNLIMLQNGYHRSAVSSMD